MATLLLPGTAAPGDVLTGKNFSAGSNYGAAGSMPNNGAVTITPGPNSQAIAAGYHNGAGAVPGVAVPAANVLTGTTIAGTAGTMPENGAMTITPGPNAQAIPAGHHNGSGSVPGVAVPAGNVLTGTTIAGTAGTMPNQGAPTWAPSTANQSLAAGYYSGGTIQAMGSASGTATSGSSTTNFLSPGDGVTPITGYYPLTVTGLGFTPRMVVVWRVGSFKLGTYHAQGYPDAGAYANYALSKGINAGPTYFYLDGSKIFNGGFTVPVDISSSIFQWAAYQ